MSINWEKILENQKNEIASVAELDAVKELVTQSDTSAEIVFGTSGWRGVIGEDFTFHNVRRVSLAILQLYEHHLERLSAELGVNSFDEFCSRGVLVGHDTRFMGPEFAGEVMKVFQNKGVRVAYAGVATTPEFSAALMEKGAPAGRFACSINLTPSHNPGNYGGYKFNPADGGPASADITSAIEANLKKISEVDSSPSNQKWESFDILRSYETLYKKSSVLDLDFCREFSRSEKISLAVDSVYGATRGRLAYLLQNPAHLTVFRDENEPFFKGLEPEPSKENMGLVISTLDKSETPLKLGFIMDPDGDRVQFYDGESHITMNDFGALAFHYLVSHKKIAGGIARSVATSSFVDKMAAQLNRPLYETKVGFKNFRPYLSENSSEPTCICFEESDGISGWEHTLEKDAHFGCILAIEIMGRTGKSLTQYLNALKSEFGEAFFQRFGFKLKDLKQPPKERLKQLHQELSSVTKLKLSDGSEKGVQSLNTADGLKVLFEDHSWFLIRPSGTEPKVRVYAESWTGANETQVLYETAKSLFFAT